MQASDGGTSNNRALEMEYLTWFKVTVIVTDVEEDGSVSLDRRFGRPPDDINATFDALHASRALECSPKLADRLSRQL